MFGLCNMRRCVLAVASEPQRLGDLLKGMSPVGAAIFFLTLSKEL